MKILVLIKRVEDPEIKITIKPDGSGIDTGQMKYVINPFDEIAVEEALRIKEASSGEIVVVTLGVEDASQQLRTALAMGCDRAIHVTTDLILDPMTAATAICAVVKQEQPDLLLFGKQAIDDDLGQTGSMVAAMLNWPQATFASKQESLESEAEKGKKAAFTLQGKELTVMREIDGGMETLALTLPAVITTELRLNVPRYASLPGIMKAKKKEIKTMALSTLLPEIRLALKVLRMETPAVRQAGMMVPDVATLVAKMQNEAKVI